MKKEYVKPILAMEVIDVELPLSASTLRVFSDTDQGVIDGKDVQFLGKDRDGDDWGGLW